MDEAQPCSADHAADGALALAGRIFVMLDRGGFVATYKYAVLLALLDLCLELTSQRGEPPTSLTTRQLAEKVVRGSGGGMRAIRRRA